MLRRKLTRIILWALAVLATVIAVAFIWLRQSPYWAGITLFSESHRVENFRDMGRVFPFREVPRGESVWTFDHAPQPLPETYAFDGQSRDATAAHRLMITPLLLCFMFGPVGWLAFFF